MLLTKEVFTKTKIIFTTVMDFDGKEEEWSFRASNVIGISKIDENRCMVTIKSGLSKIVNHPLNETYHAIYPLDKA